VGDSYVYICLSVWNKSVYLSVYIHNYGYVYDIIICVYV
jgi:hypothetical protein